MDDLIEFLGEIEKRPELYIGSRDIRSLRHFLCGYCMGKETVIPTYGDWLFGDFRIYLAEKYDDSRSIDWCALIMEHEQNGGSTDAFFRLLHEYLAANKDI